MAQEINNIAALVQVVNGLLEGGEPQNISVDTFSGFTGYKPQYIIDAMNEGVGFGNWGFEEVSNEIAEGEKALLIVSQVRVFLKDCAFQPTGWGQARITKGDIGDAKKGAQTDAIKKALSYFSIGNRAYLGLLKEDGKVKSGRAQNGNVGRTEPVPDARQSLAVQKMLATAKGRVAGLGKEWAAIKSEAKLPEVADDTLTVQMIAQINGVITTHEKKAS